METRVSVAMAVYNGELYLSQQIDSILNQLQENDELIISYNSSDDNTLNIIKEYEKIDYRVHVYICKDKGVQANFNNAICKSKGQYIFLSDQDDVWLDNKVEKIINTFNAKKAELIVHDGYITNAHLEKDGATIFNTRPAKQGILTNLLKNSYHGSCMAFRKELKAKILPIPKKKFYHDYWIGMIAEFTGKKIVFLDEELILYRRHNENQSSLKKRRLIVRVEERIYLLSSLIKRLLFKR